MTIISQKSGSDMTFRSILILPSKWGLFAKVLIRLELRNFSVEFIDRIGTSSSTKPIIVPSSMKCAKNLLITSSCCNSHQVKLSSSSSNNQPIDTDTKNPIHQTSRQQIQIEPPFSTLSLSCKTHSSLLTSSVVNCCWLWGVAWKTRSMAAATPFSNLKVCNQGWN